VDGRIRRKYNTASPKQTLSGCNMDEMRRVTA
jgi:hypothetical protein